MWNLQSTFESKKGQHQAAKSKVETEQVYFTWKQKIITTYVHRLLYIDFEKSIKWKAS